MHVHLRSWPRSKEILGAENSNTSYSPLPFITVRCLSLLNYEIYNTLKRVCKFSKITKHKSIVRLRNKITTEPLKFFICPSSNAKASSSLNPKVTTIPNWSSSFRCFSLQFYHIYMCYILFSLACNSNTI